ncbi:MAG TPA: ferredoxin reductase [Solirubrobacteraceae bacterium]
MERLTLPRAPIVWRVATVRGSVDENAHARTIVLDVPDWPGHVAGQHVDVRLTAEDGYQAQRSYSIASAPEDAQLALTVERIDDGEVSPYLADELRVRDQLEIRGPIGGHFTWRVQDGGPLLLVAGGSGLVPLMAMLRHHRAQHSDVDARLLLSARAWDDVLYRDELSQLDGRDGVRAHYTLTRTQPPGWTGFGGRVDAAMLSSVGPTPDERPQIFVCGPTAFVEHAADLLIDLGHPPQAIRAERFGPTGS